eukprot:m.384887 g.384887  ORF g.384887 m.384887 type:complete len:50 (+) comp16736_c0_seq7:249-398(+)
MVVWSSLAEPAAAGAAGAASQEEEDEDDEQSGNWECKNATCFSLPRWIS